MKFLTLPALLSLLCVSGLSLGSEKTVYGLNEYAELAGIDLQVAAKLDTGAKTASLSARDIKRFKRDGESWVRFYLAIDDAHSHARCAQQSNPLNAILERSDRCDFVIQIVL